MVLTWAKAHGFCGMEFVEQDEHIWVFIRCWDNNQCRRVCVAVLDRISRNLIAEVVLLGHIIEAIGSDVRLRKFRGQWVSAKTVQVSLV